MNKWPRNKGIVELTCDCVGMDNTIKFIFDTLDRHNTDWLVYVLHYIELGMVKGIWKQIGHRISAAWRILTGKEYLLQETIIYPEQLLRFISEMNATATQFAEVAALARSEIARKKVSLPLTNDADYYAALDKVDLLMDIREGDPREKELEELSAAVEEYEKQFDFTVDDPGDLSQNKET